MKKAGRAVQRPPLSVPLLFAPVFVCVYLLHWTLLRLPYYWDEGSYYIPAAWDFFRLGTLIPVTTMRNAHPPLPSILLAGWWKLTGFHIYSTRLFLCLVTTCALLAVFRLTRLLLDDLSALSVMALTALYPVWFAQSTLAHADMFAAAFTLWALALYADRTEWTGRPAAPPLRNAVGAGVLFSLAALAKETAIVIPAALFLLELWILIQNLRINRTDSAAKTSGTRANCFRLVATALPAVPLMLWYLYHRHATGFMFGNPEFLRYNATANLSAARMLLSMWHRFSHLTVHMGMFVPVVLALAVLVLRKPSVTPGDVPVISRGALQFVAVLLLAQWFAFSVLGGALLTRYLLPAYPLVLLLCVAAWRSRTQRWGAFAVASAVAFAVGCEMAPPYAFTPEDNLAYRDMIVVHQDAIRQLLHRYPGATVLTAWPVLADLQRPELGYVKQPVATAPVENFSAEEVAKVAARPRGFDVALVFSTKYDPPPGRLDILRGKRDNDSRYYDYHRDLRPAEVAKALGGTVVWQEDRKGEWAALLHFPART